MRGKFLQSILRQEIGWFDTHQTNDFASRVTELVVCFLFSFFFKFRENRKINWFFLTASFQINLIKRCFHLHFYIRDLNKIQEGIGEKVGMFLFFFTTFLASMINAFIHGWELTLVILAVFPLLAISTGFIAKVSKILFNS